MSKFSGLYELRNFKDSDKNFVLATFLRGLYYGNSWFNLVPKDIFMKEYKVIAEALISNSNTFISIACLKEDPDVILGYSILSSNFNTIHWVYVKSNWRRNGIGSSLLPLYPTTFSHLSELGRTLMSKYPNTIFNPFTLA